MSWLTDIIEWLLSLFNGGGSSGPVKIGDHVFMPLFYRNTGGNPDSTWGYLSKSDAEREHLRNTIKSDAESDETCAICFCLTPDNINGGLIGNSMAMVSEASLTVIEAHCKKLVESNIAVFICLYVDDPNGNMPRWWEIEKHLNIWIAVHNRIKSYVTGYILAIESNEKGNQGSIQHCIQKMRDNLPGVDFYGTHLQWKSGGAYSWSGGNAPSNANIILMETRNDPHSDVSAGFVMGDYNEVKGSNPNLNFIVHEYNLNVDSSNFKATRAALRNSNAWGVG